MTEKDAWKLAEVLAELVAWYGNENNGDHFKRVARAERLVARVAPEELKVQREAVRKANE